MQSNRVEKHAKIRMFFEKGHDKKQKKIFLNCEKLSDIIQDEIKF
jgi:hypothetical protein